jgi:hypothetical protein
MAKEPGMAMSDWQERIEDKLDRLLEAGARQAESGAARQRAIDEHSVTLYGNGHPGLKDRVLALEGVARDVGEIRAACAKNHAAGPWSKIWPTVVSTVLAAAILAVIAFAMGLWKSTPTASANPTNHAPTAQKGP